MPKLYKNTEGKVLMSVGNRLIKQPYEFGNAFQNRMGLNNYIQVPNISVNESDGFSILTWIYLSQFPNSTTRDLLFTINDDSTSKYYQLRWDSSSGIVREEYVSYLSDYVGGLGYLYNSNNLVGIKIKKGEISKRHWETNIRDLISPSEENILTKIEISRNFRNTMRQNRFLVFNRFISNEEFTFYRNNKLGNELQSTLGVALDLHNDFAEILDFSTNNYNYADYDPLNLPVGSDFRVCCRDYSGNNRHGEIINLPAGDLTQKLNYANANLFVPFLT